MNFEASAIDQVITAITNYGGYTTVWDKTIFEVQDFDTDIPSGNIHSGLCPFVAIRGGLSDDYRQVAGDLYSGTTELEIYIAVTAPLFYSRESWALIHTFTGEIERALATLDGNGFRMSPDTSKSNPVSLNQLLNRVLTISIEGSECRAAAGPPSFQSPPVLTGTPKEDNTLSVTNGTVIGTEPIAYSYNWLNVSGPAPDQNTYDVVAGDVGSTISCEVTASNGIPDDAVDESNGLEIVAMLPPVNTVAPVLSGTPNPGEVLTTTDGTWTGEAPITFTYTWYKVIGGLIGGETNNTYTVLLGDVESEIYCEVTGTNVVGFDTADSNSLEIVSGFLGLGDIVPMDWGISNTQPLSIAYGNSGNNAVAYRNGTTAAAGEIGWINNKFDVDAWDTASNFGSETLFITSELDHFGTDNAIQVGTTLQPELLRDGTVSPDGANDVMATQSITSALNSEFSFVCTIKEPTPPPAGTKMQWFWGALSMRLTDTIFTFRGGSGFTSNFAVGDLYDGNAHDIYVAYHPVNGWLVKKDDVIMLDGGGTGVFAQASSAISLFGGGGQGNSPVNIQILSLINGHTLTSQEMTDIRNQRIANDA